MIFEGMNYVAVIIAAIAGMMIGAVWYGVFAKPWIRAVGFEEDPKPEPKTYVVALAAQFVVAYILAGLIGHMGEHSLWNGVVSAVFAWLGFTLAPMSVNHRFQGSGWDLTIIDSGYWFAVFVVMGAIIGWMGV